MLTINQILKANRLQMQIDAYNSSPLNAKYVPTENTPTPYSPQESQLEIEIFSGENKNIPADQTNAHTNNASETNYLSNK